MARIVLGSYMVRYPLGGMMSWVLQYLVGLSRLGHDVYFVEKAGGPDACFDPTRSCMTDRCEYGTRRVQELLSRFDLGGRWCFVDWDGHYHGVAKTEIEAVFASADVFIDMGTHGAWLDEASCCGVRVLVDGEPAFTQLKMERRAATGVVADSYDLYFTTGQNIGTDASTAPTGGKPWRHLFHPVVPAMFDPVVPPRATAPYTTVMNWQSYEPVEFDGVCYRHKDVEFQKFLKLPERTQVRLEVAVSGRVPRDTLTAAGWATRGAHEVTHTFDSFVDYIKASRGEFGVCKSGYVVSNSGWFSDRSAAYLACGRPVVVQETGFSEHLPTGHGLFAVNTVEEAAASLEAIESNYALHSRAARDIAEEWLAPEKVLRGFLEEIETAALGAGRVVGASQQETNR